jgi:nucleotide-binding universal stress UspA family protein
MNEQARANAAAMTQQILIFYDGSNEAKQAVDVAAALFSPRHAIVLNVAPGGVTFAEGMAATSSLVPGSAFEELNKADALLRAEAGAARARRAGLDAEPRATVASATWQGIVDVADQLDAEIIVIGSHGRDGLNGSARRSVSSDVATHARQPVLIVPPVTT